MFLCPEPEVRFVSGLSDTAANLGETAELSCTLSSKDCSGIWYKDGQKVNLSNSNPLSVPLILLE